MATLIGLDMISCFVWYVANTYPSNTINYQPLESVVGIFDAFHALIDEKIYQGRPHKELAKLEYSFMVGYIWSPKYLLVGSVWLLCCFHPLITWIGLC